MQNNVNIHINGDNNTVIVNQNIEQKDESNSCCLGCGCFLVIFIAIWFGVLFVSSLSFAVNNKNIYGILTFVFSILLIITMTIVNISSQKPSEKLNQNRDKTP